MKFIPLFFKKTKLIPKIGLRLVVLMVLISNFSFGQIEIYRESFSNLTNCSTTTGTFAGTGDNSGDCSTTLDAFTLDACTRWSGAVADGGNQSFFYVQDMDAVGTAVTTKNITVDLGSVAGGNTGEIVFYGLFGSQLPTTSAAYDAEDSVAVYVSVNGGSSYIRKLWITKAATDRLQISNGTTTDLLGTTYIKRSVSLGSGLNGQNIKVRLIFYNICAGAEAVAIDEFSLAHIPISDDESTIEENGFDEPDNIAYTSYSAASGLTTGNSIKVGSFIIKDGGADNTDADSYSTILNSISLDILNSSYLKALAIFDGTSNISEKTTVSATTTFSGLTLTATDNSTKSFDLYATFQNTVVDNSQIQFTVSNTTSSASGSNFAAINAGGAYTSVAGDDNRLEVTATKLIVTADANAAVNQNFDVYVYAADANNNTDLDNTSSVTLSLTVGTGAFSSVSGLTQSLVSGYYNWTDCRSSVVETITVQASGGGLAAGTANITLVSPKIYYVNNNNNTDGDKWCTAVGNNSNNGTSAGAPKLTLKNLWNTYHASFVFGDTIKIDAGTYSLDGTGTSTDEHDFNIDIAGITFIGAGWTKTIFDHNYGGTNTDYFMYITADNVTLKDIQITEFENLGTVTAAGHTGQAITIDGASNILLDHILLNLNGQAGGNPSISINDNSTVTIIGGGSSCNVWQTAYTGGVETYGNNITLNIESYLFAYNYKEGSYDGGGLLMGHLHGGTEESMSNVTVNINNSKFYNNNSSDGGGISQKGGTLNVTDCVFDGNTVGQTSVNVYGAAVRITGGTATFTRTRFTNNTNDAGTLHGAGIAAYADIRNVNLTLDNCYFSGNSGANGDDLYLRKGDGGTVTVSCSQTTFSSSGDAIYNASTVADPTSITLTNCGNPTVAGTNTPSLIKSNTTAPSSVPDPDGFPIMTGDCSSFTLPIDLIDFTGECNNNVITLNWATASEINNNYFTIEKSEDAQNWTTLAFVEGAGNSNSNLYYSYTDDAQVKIRQYYRLKQTDFDGEFSYSEIISVAPCYEGYFDMIVLNNPLGNIMNLLVNTSDTQNAKIFIQDLTGRLLYYDDLNLESGDNTITVDLSKMSNGLYLVKILPEFNGKPIVKEVIINK